VGDGELFPGTIKALLLKMSLAGRSMDRTRSMKERVVLEGQKGRLWKFGDFICF
jgi:hypothetical protein